MQFGPVTTGDKRRAGVDEGFELYYFDLSWRRKTFRTLWFWALLLAMLFVDVFAEYRAVMIFGLALGVVQFGYNFWRWRAEVRRLGL